MKNATIRLVVILAAISIVGITITQIYWVKRAFNLKEDEFERSVNTALYNVAQKIFEINQSPSPAVNPVKQLSTNYFVVMVNNEVNPNTLEFLLQTEFKRRNIIADFEYGVFDCTTEKMVYGDYVPLQTAKEKITNKKLPTWTNQGYYFGVQFPNREAQLLNQMGIWSFSSVVLLIVIFFFAYTLFIILKQKRLSEIQKDFINNMTHEFKTPISTIAVSAQVLKDPKIINQPERLLNYAEIIEKENIRLRQHVERVLQIARLDKEEIELKKESSDIHTLIEGAAKNVSLLLQEKKGNITLELSADIHHVEADKLHLTNVFTNLLDNAIKYCSTQPEILIRSFNYENKIGIEIKDNGMGIHLENQKKVFQKFYRVHTGNVHDVKGFGLGLSYVRSIVKAHRGEIKLFSEIGKGSTFSLFISQSRI